LRAIQGYGDLLAAEAGAILDSTALKHLEHVRNSARRMNTLIDAMLRLSQVSRSDVQVRPVHVGAIARSILNTLQRTTLQRKVRTIVDTDLMADGDEALLRLALENLLSNAWNFSVHVEDAQIEFITTTEEDGRTVYCVRDNGAGFDMRFADRLFGVFQRLHSASDFQGTGVGLASARRIVRRHGGDIWAESEVGQGARFFFTLPG
jgi:signal transduction histidine kinase